MSLSCHEQIADTNQATLNLAVKSESKNYRGQQKLYPDDSTPTGVVYGAPRLVVFRSLSIFYSLFY